MATTGTVSLYQLAFVTKMAAIGTLSPDQLAVGSWPCSRAYLGFLHVVHLHLELLEFPLVAALVLEEAAVLLLRRLQLQ